MSRAQSEVIGEIFLAAIVVLSVTTIGIAYLESVRGDDSTLVELSEVSTDDSIELAHAGGEPLTNESTRIILRDGSDSVTLSLADGSIVNGTANGRLEPGDIWRWDAFAESGFTSTSFDIIVATDNQILLQTTKTVSADAAASSGTLSDATVSSLTKSTTGQSQTFEVTLNDGLRATDSIEIDLSEAEPPTGPSIVDYSAATVTSSSPNTDGTLDTAESTLTLEPATLLADGTEITVTLDDIDVADPSESSLSVPFARTDSGATTSATLLLFEPGDVTTGDTSGPVYASGDIIVDFDALVDGEAIAGGSVTLRDRAEVTDDIEAVTDVTIGFDGIVGGNISSADTVTLNDRADISGGISSDGSATFGSTTRVDGPVDVGGALAVSTDATLGNDVTAAGSLSFGSGTTTTGDVSAGGSVTLGNDVDIGGALTSGGSMTAGDRTSVDGDIDAVSSVSFNTDGVIGGTITTDGSVSLGDRTTVSGDIIADSLSCGNNVVINGQSCEDYITANY